MFYQYTTKYILREMSLKERILIQKHWNSIFLFNFDTHRCTLEVMEIGWSISFFSMYLKDKAFKYLKKLKLFLQFQVTFYMYLDIGRDNDNDYEESSKKDYCESHDDEKHALIR